MKEHSSCLCDNSCSSSNTEGNQLLWCHVFRTLTDKGNDIDTAADTYLYNDIDTAADTYLYLLSLNAFLYKLRTLSTTWSKKGGQREVQLWYVSRVDYTLGTMSTSWELWRTYSFVNSLASSIILVYIPMPCIVRRVHCWFKYLKGMTWQSPW